MLRNRIIFSILLVGSSLLVYYIPNYITSLFFHTTVFLMLFSFFHLFYCYIKITASQKITPTIVEHSQKTKYICSIYNETIIPFSSITIDFLFHSSMFKDQLKPVSFSVMPHESRIFSYDLTCKYRGVYSVGIDTLEMRDSLNILSFKVRNLENRNITVLPKVTSLPNYNLMPRAHSDFKSSAGISAEGADSLVDVRSFEQGDSIKHIHWKLSAHHDELLVRNLERSSENSTLVFLDTSKGVLGFEENTIVEDKLMEAYVSIVNQCILKNHIIELNYFSFGMKNFIYNSREDFHEFFINSAKVTFWNDESIRKILEQYFTFNHPQQNLWGKDVFIFTCNQSKIENHAILRRLLSNHCSVNIVSSTHTYEKERIYRSNEGINYYVLTPSSEIDTIFVRGTT